MYKEIDQNFVIETLQFYDERTHRLHRDMSHQYSLLSVQDEDLLEAAARAGLSRNNTADDIIMDYLSVSRQRLQDIKKRMREIIEEQESMNRVMAAYDKLPAASKEILGEFYIHNLSNRTIYDIADQIAKRSDKSVATIFRLRKKAIRQLIELYNSDLTQSEIFQLAALQKDQEDKYR